MILLKSKKTIRVAYKTFAFLVFSMFLLLANASDNLPDNPDNRGGIRKGIASFYADMFEGRKTANGEIFSQKKLTCASNLFPLGTWLKITNIKTGKSVIVKVNDRMHPRMKRVVDLTKKAATELGMVKQGIAEVQVESLGKDLPAEIGSL